MCLEKNQIAIGELMFSNQTVRTMDENRKAETLLPYEESPRHSHRQKGPQGAG